MLGSSVITEEQNPLESHCSAFQRQLRDRFSQFPQMISKRVSEISVWNWRRHDPFICLLHKLIWMRAFNLCPKERDREDEKSEGVWCLSPHPPYILGINFEPQRKKELETEVEEAIIGGAGDKGYNNGTSNATSGPGGEVLHRDGDKASFTLNPSYSIACCH